MTVPAQPTARETRDAPAPPPSTPLVDPRSARQESASAVHSRLNRTAVDEQSLTIGQLAVQVEKSLSTLISAEIELAKLELTASVKNAGVGAVAFIAAGVLLVFSLTFGLIALAEGLVAAHIWRWAAYLIVFGFLLVVIGLLLFVGIRKVKRVKAPKQTIETTKESIAYVRKHG